MGLEAVDPVMVYPSPQPPAVAVEWVFRRVVPPAAGPVFGPVERLPHGPVAAERLLARESVRLPLIRTARRNWT